MPSLCCPASSPLDAGDGSAALELLGLFVGSKLACFGIEPGEVDVVGPFDADLVWKATRGFSRPARLLAVFDADPEVACVPTGGSDRCSDGNVVLCDEATLALGPVAVARGVCGSG